jgi:hypothetical protein
MGATTGQRPSSGPAPVGAAPVRPGVPLELTFDLDVDPTELTSDEAARSAFERELAPRATRLGRVIVSPVALTLTCVALPSDRPATIDYPNLHRWLAPLVDSLVGIDRLLVSSAQVRSVEVRTTPPTGDPGRLTVTVAFPGAGPVRPAAASARRP